MKRTPRKRLSIEQQIEAREAFLAKTIPKIITITQMVSAEKKTEAAYETYTIDGFEGFGFNVFLGTPSGGNELIVRKAGEENPRAQILHVWWTGKKFCIDTCTVHTFNTRDEWQKNIALICKYHKRYVRIHMRTKQLAEQKARKKQEAAQARSALMEKAHRLGFNMPSI